MCVHIRQNLDRYMHLLLVLPHSRYTRATPRLGPPYARVTVSSETVSSGFHRHLTPRKPACGLRVPAIPLDCLARIIGSAGESPSFDVACPSQSTSPVSNARQIQIKMALTIHHALHDSNPNTGPGRELGALHERGCRCGDSRGGEAVPHVLRASARGAPEKAPRRGLPHQRFDALIAPCHRECGRAPNIWRGLHPPPHYLYNRNV